MKRPRLPKTAKVTATEIVPATTPAFDEVVALIDAAKRRAHRAVNVELIDLYWKVGMVIDRRIKSDGWGRGTVESLSLHLQRTRPGARGFSPQNLWRMRQLYETYRDAPELSTLVRELPWSSNLHILSGTKRREEREFYLRLATQKHWNVRELARQIDSALFEREILSKPKLSTALREVHPEAPEHFKDAYFVEFIDLPEGHTEADFHSGLLRNLGRFITELGRDFCFVGSEYPVQVGGQDFAIDLLFFHRSLQCLVAIELKVREFRPEDLGKLSFYLEALDRDVRKPHERPSIGMLLCATKNTEVVEYALSRTLSPALVAEYQTVLPPKALLQAKLHEIYDLLAPLDESSPKKTPPAKRAMQKSASRKGQRK